MLDDTFDTKKEIEEYIKTGLKNIVEAKKAKKPKAEPKKKAAKAPKSDDEKEEEKAKKEEEKAKKAEEKAAEKAKKAEDKAAEKAKKDEEKAAEKAKKAVETEEDSDDEPKKRPEKKAKAPKVAKAVEIDEEGNVIAKAKKPPTERKIFYDEMRIKVKEMFPDLNPQQTTKKIAELWKVKLARLAEANEKVMNDAMNASDASS